jgi:arsenite methyltransferase
MNEEKNRQQVREGYAKVALEQSSCCGSSATHKESRRIGYSDAELGTVPEGANMGLGCGNPIALASLRKGETVIDLGSGGGLDCFLAAKRVGRSGRVIGVDMTPEMVDKARRNAKDGNYANVEFRLGEIENLPIADNSADAIISNCVINLTTNKKRVFEEAFRVLKPGGRVMISDLVLLKELPAALRKRIDPTSCITGAVLKDQYLDTIRTAGFQNVSITEEKQYYYEDLPMDPDATVLILNAKTNATETKRVSELDEKTRERMKQSMKNISSISVSATKPIGISPSPQS